MRLAKIMSGVLLVGMVLGVLLPVSSAGAQGTGEEADLKIELLDLPLGRGQPVVQVRITNVSDWWADATTARLVTVSPGPANELDLDVQNLDPGQSATYTYPLASPCNAHVVQVQVAPASNYAGVKEANTANNSAQMQVCPAAPSEGVVAAVPIDPNARIGDVLGRHAPPQPMVDENLLPGTHTVTLWPEAWKPAWVGKVYDDQCGWLSSLRALEGHVGWGQSEIGEFPNNGACGAEVLQMAVRFDRALLNRVPDKTINRAVLLYDEAPGASCPMVLGYTFTCWQSGDWKPEDKPNGCVVVRVPRDDWVSWTTRGLIPYSTTTHPQIVRLGTREWDVTEPFTWQYDARRYMGLVEGANVGTPGYGLLLSGGPSLDQLTADDNTICISRLSNIRLSVTYTVPQPGDRQGPVVR